MPFVLCYAIGLLIAEIASRGVKRLACHDRQEKGKGLLPRRAKSSRALLRESFFSPPSDPIGDSAEDRGSVDQRGVEAEITSKCSAIAPSPLGPLIGCLGDPAPEWLHASSGFSRAACLACLGGALVLDVETLTSLSRGGSFSGHAV